MLAIGWFRAGMVFISLGTSLVAFLFCSFLLWLVDEFPHIGWSGWHAYPTHLLRLFSSVSTSSDPDPISVENGAGFYLGSAIDLISAQNILDLINKPTGVTQP